MKRPKHLQPFFVDSEGRESPLLVPPSMLDVARQTYKTLWVEPNLPMPERKG